jgi:hypothetical protein
MRYGERLLSLSVRQALACASTFLAETARILALHPVHGETDEFPYAPNIWFALDVGGIQLDHFRAQIEQGGDFARTLPESLSTSISPIRGDSPARRTSTRCRYKMLVDPV